MIFIEELGPDERFDLGIQPDGKTPLRTGIRESSGKELDFRYLVALTLNDIACERRIGYFWANSYHTVGVTLKHPADLFYENISWTKQNVKDYKNLKAYQKYDLKTVHREI